MTCRACGKPLAAADALEVVQVKTGAVWFVHSPAGSQPHCWRKVVGNRATHLIRAAGSAAVNPNPPGT